ncbi:hypothetical protein B0H11DRAFT_2273094 [Mycena galericulata]|nr:hypothetical protein B0H11DRAFT_2273094 [Mycena galericulata]
MTFSDCFRVFFFHKPPMRPDAVTSSKDERTSALSDPSHALSVQDCPEEKHPPTQSRGSEATHTAINVLKLALTTLSAVSSNIPLAGVLSGVIDPLLAIADRIQQTSDNQKGLVELSARIELLAPVLSETGHNRRIQGQLVEALNRELYSIKEDLDAASSRGTLAQFFNSEDNSSSLAKHNATLTQMIADSTFATVNEVLKNVQALEWKFSQSPPTVGAEGINEMGNITGGLGGTGGHARTGGQGGEGDGPQLDISAQERWKIGDISGGTGGWWWDRHRRWWQGWNWESTGDQNLAAAGCVNFEHPGMHSYFHGVSVI